MHVPSRLVALGEGGVVTLLLGSTLVIAKASLVTFGPVTLAALRYCIAFLAFLPFLLQRRAYSPWNRELWGRLIAIGLSFYVVGNGALFLGLRYLPATTASLLLSFVPLLVLGASVVWLHELPGRGQLIGVAICLAGGMLFFAPGVQRGKLVGFAILTVGLIGNAAFGLLGRERARDRGTDIAVLTGVPLGIGGVILLPIAALTEGVPRVTVRGIIVVCVLALANTVVVFLLYNHTLRVLTALEMSTLTSLSPLVTALLAWGFLGERLLPVQLVGIAVVVGGVALVQLSKRDTPRGPRKRDGR